MKPDAAAIEALILAWKGERWLLASDAVLYEVAERVLTAAYAADQGLAAQVATLRAYVESDYLVDETCDREQYRRRVLFETANEVMPR